MYVVHPPKYGPNSVQRSIPSSIQAWQKSALVGSGKNRLQWNKAVPPFPKSKCPPKTAGGYSPIRVRMDRVEQYSSIQWYSPLFNIFHPYSSTKNRQISFHRWRELHDDEVRGEIHHWERRGSTRWFQRWGMAQKNKLKWWFYGDLWWFYGVLMVI